MFGEFKAKIKELMLYITAIKPKKDNVGEVFRGKGSAADFNITIDDDPNTAYTGGFNLYYNIQNKFTGGYSDPQIEKGGVNAGFIWLDPEARSFGVGVADGSNANSGDYPDWKWLLSSTMYGTFTSPDIRLGVGVKTPAANLHVKGKVRIDDTTSTTATAGTATLPTAPVAFLTININGTDYKIPLYGV